MASKVDCFNLSEEQDRRRRLTTQKKCEIFQKYQTGSYSLRALAREYNVSHKTIAMIVNPKSKAKNDEYTRTHWMYYKRGKEERAETMRKTRAYKKKLFEKGEL